LLAEYISVVVVVVVIVIIIIIIIIIIITKVVSYNPQNLNHDVVSMDILPEFFQLWVQLRYPIYP
jgi:amino acid transporter